MDEHKTLTVERFLILLLLITLIFGMRLALTVGAMKIPLIFCMGLPIILILFFYNRLIIDPKKFILIVISLVFILISSLWAMFAGNDFSFTSLFYLLAFYLPIIFIYKDNSSFTFLLSSYQFCIMIIAVIGIVQFMLQVVGFQFLDPLEYVPPQFMMENYNTHNPLYYGARIIKSNGIFLLEPSFFILSSSRRRSSLNFSCSNG